MGIKEGRKKKSWRSFCLRYSSSGSKHEKWKENKSHSVMSNPMDYRVHGILQARILEWVTFPFSRVTSQHKDGTQVSQPRFPALWADSFPPESQGSPRILEWVSYSFYRASSRPRNPTSVSCL